MPCKNPHYEILDSYYILPKLNAQMSYVLNTIKIVRDLVINVNRTAG